MSHLACGAGGETCGTCDWGVECTGGMCTTEIAAGQSFYIAVERVVVPEKNGDASWDPLGGLPDPFVCFSDGTTTGCTTTQSDTTTATWSGGYTLTNSSGEPVLFSSDALLAGELAVTVWDDDVDASDEIQSLQYDQGIGVKQDEYVVTDVGKVVELVWRLVP